MSWTSSVPRYRGYATGQWLWQKPLRLYTESSVVQPLKPQIRPVEYLTGDLPRSRTRVTVMAVLGV